MTRYTAEGASPHAAYGAEQEIVSCPASFAQRRLWFLHELAPQSAAYNIATARRLLGAFEPDAFRAACTALVARHESLRTTFAQEAGEPAQQLHPAPTSVAVPLVSLEQLDAAGRETELQRMVARESAAPFDLARGPLFRPGIIRLSPTEHVITVTLHHIVSDGWSMQLMFRELDALYRAAARTESRAPARLIADAGLEPLLIQYADYSVWQREWLSGDELQRQEEYWTTRLAPPLPQLTLPTDRARPSVQGNHGACHWFTLSADLASALRTLSRREGATMFMTLLAAYDVLLHRYSGQEDIVVGTPIAGRTRSETEALIGCFVNTLALRANLSGAPTFSELLRRVRADTLDAYAHQDLPFERVVQLLHPDRDRSRTAIFQTMFVLQNAREADQAGGATFGGLPVSGVAVPIVTSKFDLQLTFAERGGTLSGALTYDTDLFDPATVERFAVQLEALLTAIVARPDARIDELDLFGPGERDLVLHEWNATRRDYPVDDTLVSLIGAQTAATPDAVAVASGSRTLTFAALDARSTELAEHLASLGVAPGALVGVALERSLELMVALLAVLKTGAAYVPIDPDYPAERVSFMLEDAHVAVLLTQSHLVSRLPVRDETRVIALDGEWRQHRSPRTTPLPSVSPASMAYMIYTSGSTGRPKGALNTHRGIVNRLRWMQQTYALTPRDVVLQKTPISFDVSVWELFWPLLTGARLVLAAPGGHRDPAHLAETIRTHGVTVLHFVPSMLRLFLAHPGSANCPSLRDVMCSGEALPRDLQDRFFEVFDHARLHNLYGPTECAVDVSFWECRRDERAPNIPIGRPVANTQLYVLDERLRPLPVGLEGELYIAGVQVGAGYLNRPELTAERFIPDPFAAHAGAQMYRTGDRARWRSDGALEYLGRRDGQIKLRGFRIELGEVESALRAAPSIVDCVVDVRDGTRGDQLLVVYYVVADAEELGSDAAETLRTHARRVLPEFMVPNAFIAIAAVPRSPSGKIDRRSLPAPVGHQHASPHPHVPPRTTLEHELVHIWQVLLRKESIGIRDDFFELGGHSLLAAQMLFEIELARGQRLPLASLFDGATIERLAARLEAAVEDEREPDVVVLQDEGTETPFAFVHGDVRGGGWYCRRMAALLGAEVPLIVLPTLRPEGDARPHTIEAMARAHVATLRRVQPHGPYRLGGFCVGGLIAYEMARQLAAMGERVERVAVIDSSGSNSRFGWLAPFLGVPLQGPADKRLARRAALLRSLRYYTGRIQRVRRMERQDQWSWVKTNVARRLRGGIERPMQPRDALTFTGERADRSAEFDARPATQLLRAQERAALAYIPASYDGTLDVIWAADQFPPRSVDPTRGWARVASDVRVHMVSSAHVGLITYNLPTLAETLRACLRPEDVAVDS